jgi:hypothetical protein
VPPLLLAIRRLKGLLMMRSVLSAGLAALLLFWHISATHAVPYASRVVINSAPSLARFNSVVAPTTAEVSFVLNEPADEVAYSINGGPLQWLDGSTKGTKTFSLSSPLDKFSILVKNMEAEGYTIPTGDVALPGGNGLSQIVPASGLRLVSDVANPLHSFNAARGVGVNLNPNSPYFGVAYVGNASFGQNADATRYLSRGVYALAADGSDAFGYGDAIYDPIALFPGGGATVWRIAVGADDEVYVADASILSHGLVRLDGQLQTGVPMFNLGFGQAPLPLGANHGRITGFVVSGSPYDGTLVVHTVDRDFNSGQVSGTDTNDLNSVWRYDLGFDAQLSMQMPTKVNTASVLPLTGMPDLERGADGKFYLSNSLLSGASAGIVVLDAQGEKIYDSLTATRAMLNDPNVADVMRNVMGIAISPDQKWLAAMLRSGDVAILPVVDGIPDLSEVMIVETSIDSVPGRDVAFDAAGNLHYIIGGIGGTTYRVISPGGTTFATTTWDGASMGFRISSVPEPASLALAGAGLIAAGAMRRRLPAS